MVGCGMFLRLVLMLNSGDLEDTNYKVWRCGFLSEQHLQHFIQNLEIIYQQKWKKDENKLYDELLLCEVGELMSEWKAHDEFISSITQETMHDEHVYKHLQTVHNIMEKHNKNAKRKKKIQLLKTRALIKKKKNKK